MTIKEGLKKYSSVEIDLLLSHILGKPKEFLFMSPVYELTQLQINKLAQMVKRRLVGEPIAYILGYKDFMGHRFKVNKDVLIPRPETEWLVEHVLNILRAKRSGVEKFSTSSNSIKILDLGTGSGCIAVSLARQLQNWNIKHQITASDVSPAALAIARQNAKQILHYHTGVYDSGVKFIQSDLLASIKGKFDIIIANLPYVTTKDYRTRIKNLGYEPKKALTDGTNRWEIYKRFFEQVPYRLSPNGIIYLEIDPKAKPKLLIWAKKNLPSANIKFYKDYNNLWRHMTVMSK